MTRAAPLLAALTLIAGCGQAGTERADRVETRSCPRISGAKTLAWTDAQPLGTGGRLIFVTRSVAVDGRDYVVRGSVTNRTQGSIGIRLYSAEERPEYVIGPESFGIAYREDASPGNLHTRKMINFRATVFAPPLPDHLAPGETWRGLFCGRSRNIPQHHEWWVVYGDFAPGGHWLTDKTFRTP